ncbi:MAG: hypothetical protein ACE5E7_05450 [Anaerolineae bacterium]
MTCSAHIFLPSSVRSSANHPELEAIKAAELEYQANADQMMEIQRKRPRPSLWRRFRLRFFGRWLARDVV